MDRLGRSFVAGHHPLHNPLGMAIVVADGVANQDPSKEVGASATAVVDDGSRTGWGNVGQHRRGPWTALAGRWTAIRPQSLLLVPEGPLSVPGLILGLSTAGYQIADEESKQNQGRDD